jgi:2',3'-cyclic-nucleotide 2'-phosphodiesterase (5'-nucleotidase family)
MDESLLVPLSLIGFTTPATAPFNAQKTVGKWDLPNRPQTLSERVMN